MAQKSSFVLVNGCLYLGGVVLEEIIIRVFVWDKQNRPFYMGVCIKWVSVEWQVVLYSQC